jgi:hypothetical protein
MKEPVLERLIFDGECCALEGGDDIAERVIWKEQLSLSMNGWKIF